MIICDRCTKPLPDTKNVETVYFNKFKVFTKHLCDPCNKVIFRKIREIGEEEDI